MDQYVTIVNNDPEVPFVGKYDGEYITIPTGGQKVVPYDVMRVWMGDPILTDDGRHNDRHDAYNRLCSLYHARGLTGNDPSLLPDISAFTEDGEQIITILDDPEGETLVPDSEGTSDISQLQRQIDRLKARLEEQVAGLVDEPGGTIEPAEIGGRTGEEGVIAAETAAAKAELYGDTPQSDSGSDDDLDIPEDAPTQIPVGRPKQSASPAKKASPRPRKTPAKKPVSKPRGTAGTEGRRAGTK